MAHVETHLLQAQHAKVIHDKLEGEIQSKANKNDVDLLAILIDKNQRDIEDNTTVINELNKDIKTKAEVSDIANIVYELDKATSQLNSLVYMLKTKAEQNDMISIAHDLDKINFELIELQKMIDIKAQQNDLIMVASYLDTLDLKLIELSKTKAEINEVASAMANIEQLHGSISIIQTSINNIISMFADVNTSISQKASLPTSSPLGTLGQVLSTNGDGTTTWINPSTPSDEQIESAVTSWLDDHPEATTTVEDGSITLSKLSTEVKNKIDNSEEARDLSVLLDGMYTIEHTYQSVDREIQDQLDFINKYQNKFADFASYVTGGDALMFTFFTDPHSMDSKSYNVSPTERLLRLKEAKWVTENTAAQFCLCGGDWINHTYTKQEAMLIEARVPNLLKTEIGPNAYTIAGNHDLNTESSSTQWFTEEQLGRIWFDRDECFYTIEGRNWKGLMCDSGYHAATSMTTYRWREVDWFANQLLTNTKPHVFGAIHVWQRNGVETDLIDNLTYVATAYNKRNQITLNNITYDYSSITSGTFHFFISGHRHDNWTNIGKEYFTTKSHGIPTYCTAATADGICIDACYVDFDEAMIHEVRFGHGTNKTSSGDNRDFKIIPNGGYEINDDDEE